MVEYINATFNLCDHLNPGFGYQLRIENARTGEQLLFTSKRPDTGTALLTARDCVEIIDMYCKPAERDADHGKGLRR